MDPRRPAALGPGTPEEGGHWHVGAPRRAGPPAFRGGRTGCGKDRPTTDARRLAGRWRWRSYPDARGDWVGASRWFLDPRLRRPGS
ncbi:MAG: hypothetical protein ACJ8GN_15785 [Longimicrobiaceae bacterium]